VAQKENTMFNKAITLCLRSSLIWDDIQCWLVTKHWVVTKYPSTLCTIEEVWRCHLYHGRSLKSRNFMFFISQTLRCIGYTNPHIHDTWLCKYLICWIKSSGMQLICHCGTSNKNVVFLGLLDPEDENTMILWNVKYYSHNFFLCFADRASQYIYLSG